MTCSAGFTDILLSSTRYRCIDCRKFGLDRIPKFRPEILKRMLNISFWTMIQNVFSLSTWFLFFLYVEHLGERSLPSRTLSGHIRHSVHGNDGIASTCGSLVSNLIGAGDKDCVAGTIRQHIRIAYLFTLPLALFFCTVPKTYTGNLYGYTRFTGCSRFTLGNVLGISVSRTCQCIFPGSIRNGKHAHGPLVMELTLVFYVAYITYIILLKLDVALCWTSEMVYSIFYTITLLVVY